MSESSWTKKNKVPNRFACEVLSENGGFKSKSTIQPANHPTTAQLTGRRESHMLNQSQLISLENSNLQHDPNKITTILVIDIEVIEQRMTDRA